MKDTANFSEYIAYLYKMRDGKRFRYDPSQGDYQTWAAGVRKILEPHLTLQDDGAPLNVKTLDVKQKDGYRQETIELNVDGYLRLKGAVLVPENGEKKHPAVVALNCHGWQYYYDLYKMLEPEEEIPYITKMKDDFFGSRSVANEMAKRGYLVVYLETFYFGENRLDVENVPQLFKDEFHVDPAQFEKGSLEYIDASDLFSRRFEAYMYKYLAFAGQSWTGLNLKNDKKAIDYLLTRDDVDPDRIGCVGLSLGGFRSLMLAGMDERIKCAVVAGWMACLPDMLEDSRCKFHTFMMFQPSLWALIDFPDLVALNAPNSLIVINGLQDEQFKGADKADDRMKKIYAMAGHPENYVSNFYDTPHMFNAQMQDDAYAFMETHLKNLK